MCMAGQIKKNSNISPICYNVLKTVCIKKTVEQIPGVVFRHILHKATRMNTDNVITIKAITTGKITSAKDG